MMHLYSAFCVLLYTQSALQSCGGVSPQPPPGYLCFFLSGLAYRQLPIPSHQKATVPPLHLCKVTLFLVQLALPFHPGASDKSDEQCYTIIRT